MYESVKAVTQPVKVEAVDVAQAPSKMTEFTSLLLRLALSAGLSLVLGKILLDMMDPTRKEKKSAEKRVNSNDDTYMYFVYLLRHACRGHPLSSGHSDPLCVCCIRGILDIYMQFVNYLIFKQGTSSGDITPPTPK